MKIEVNPSRVANLLKEFINFNCEDGFTWYKNIGEMPTLFDINIAIKLLEKEETRVITVVEGADE